LLFTLYRGLSGAFVLQRKKFKSIKNQALGGFMKNR
jgi:hypothetical protein